MNVTQRSMGAQYIYSAPVSCANGYIKTQKNKLQTIKKRIYKKLRSSIAKRSKISPNINQLIKSTVFIAGPTKWASVAPAFFKVGLGAGP